MKVTPSASKIVIEWEQSPSAASPASVSALKKALSSVKEVQSVKLSGIRQKKIVVTYKSSQRITEFLRQITRTLRSAYEQNGQPHEDASQTLHPIPKDGARHRVSFFQGLKLRVYGFLAWGSFVMAWVGLIVPGIPTLPFVILTVYFAEKVSPTLRLKMMSMPFIGPAMRDWYEHHAIRRSTKNWIYILLAAMILSTLLVAPVDSVTFMSMMMMAALTYYMINRIPVMDDPFFENQPGLAISAN